MLILGALFWRTGAGAPTPPTPPVVADDVQPRGQVPWLLGAEEQTRRARDALARRLREEAGKRAAQVIERVAESQVARLESDQAEQRAELRATLKAQRLEYKKKYDNLLAEYRNFLLDEEIRERLQFDDDIAAILIIAASA